MFVEVVGVAGEDAAVLLQDPFEGVVIGIGGSGDVVGGGGEAVAVVIEEGGGGVGGLVAIAVIGEHFATDDGCGMGRGIARFAIGVDAFVGRGGDVADGGVGVFLLEGSGACCGG